MYSCCPCILLQNAFMNILNRDMTPDKKFQLQLNPINLNSVNQLKPYSSSKSK